MIIGFYLQMRERKEWDIFGLIKDTEDKEMLEFQEQCQVDDFSDSEHDISLGDDSDGPTFSV